MAISDFGDGPIDVGHRHLAAILLDLRAEQERADLLARSMAQPGHDDDALDRMSAASEICDVTIDRLREEAKAALLRDTGVQWARIEEAGL